MNNPFSSNNETTATLKDLHKILFTFLLISITAIYFRAETLIIANDYIVHCFNFNEWGFLEVRPWYFFMMIVLFIVIEWKGRIGSHALNLLGLSWNNSVRFLFYFSIGFIIIWWSGKEQTFIYFQF